MCIVVEFVASESGNFLLFRKHSAQKQGKKIVIINSKAKLNGFSVYSLLNPFLGPIC